MAELDLFAKLDTPEQQNEYMLVVAALDCVNRNRGDWLAVTTSWFDPMWIIDPYFRKLYKNLCKMADEGIPITSRILAERFPVEDTLFGNRAAEMYALMVDSSAQGGNLQYYAKQVCNYYRRAMASDDLSGMAEDMRTTKDPDSVLKELPKLQSKYAMSTEDRAKNNRSVIQTMLDKLEGKIEVSRVGFGIDALDRAVLMAPGSLITFTAQTSGGKSVMLGQTALNCALRYDKHALLFSYEMTVEDFANRFAPYLCGYPNHPPRIGNEPLPHDWDRARYIDGINRLQRHIEGDGKLEIFHGGTRTVEALSSEARAWCSKVDVGVIVVDYCQLIHDTNPKDPREQRVAHAINSLKALASDIGVPIVTASQVNKEGGTRESQAIQNASNTLIHLEPDGDPDRGIDKIKMFIKKNRDGALKTVYAFWEKPLWKMRDLERDDERDIEYNQRHDYRDYN